MFMVHHRAVHQATRVVHWMQCSWYSPVENALRSFHNVLQLGSTQQYSGGNVYGAVHSEQTNRRLRLPPTHPPSAVRGGLCRVLGTTWQSFNLHKCESWSKKRRKIQKFFGAKSSWHSIHDSTYRGLSFKAVQRRYRVAPIWGQFNDPVPPSWRVS